ncbi:hypothetical protein LSAT2_019305 [Lamellibrachia satsuma]|nr:hypothetical protein LSAT2_019305 [Lamellibrachia satsuma]
MLGLFGYVPISTYKQHDINVWLLYKEGFLGRIQQRQSTTRHLNRDLRVSESEKHCRDNACECRLTFRLPGVDEEADDPSLSVNEDSDETSADGARVKRATGVPSPPAGAKAPKGLARHAYGGCRCYSWGYVHCHWTSWGCFCYGPLKYGGCLVYVRYGSHYHWAYSQGNRGAYCYCRSSSKYVRSYSK